MPDKSEKITCNEQISIKEWFMMSDLWRYPENRLDIRVDENGNMTFAENREFAKYYAPTREEMEEELEELLHRQRLLELDEPTDPSGLAYDEWEEAMEHLEERIHDLEERIENIEERE